MGREGEREKWRDNRSEREIRALQKVITLALLKRPCVIILDVICSAGGITRNGTIFQKQQSKRKVYKITRCHRKRGYGTYFCKPRKLEKPGPSHAGG